MHHIRFRRKSLFFTWLFSYLWMLAIPVLLCLVVFIISSSSFRNQIKDTNEVSMQYLRQSMDDRIYSLKKMLIDTAWDMRVTGFISQGATLAPEQYMQVTEIINYLKKQNVTNDWADILQIYFSNSDLILSSTAMYTPGDMYRHNYQSPAQSYSQWYEQQRTRQRTEYRLCSFLNSLGQTKTGFAIDFYLPIGLRGEERMQGKVTAVADIDRLVENLKTIRYSPQVNLFILDSSNRIMAATHDEGGLENTLLEYDFSGDGKTQFIEINDRRYALAYMPSQIMELNYVSLVPIDAFYQQLTQLQQIIAFGIVACLLLGILNAYLLSKTNYKKLQEITGKIVVDKLPNPSDSRNEFEMISQYIDLSNEYKREIGQRIAAHRGVLREQCLRSLLTGGLQQEDEPVAVLANCDIRFLGDRFSVGLIAASEFAEKDFKKQMLNQKTVLNLFQQMSGEYLCFFAFQTLEYMVILASLSENATEKTLCSQLEQACATALSEFNLRCVVGVGSVHQTLFGIPQSYQEAIEMLDYRMVMGHRQVLYHGQIVANQTNQKGIYLTLENQQRLVNSLKAEDMEQASLIVETTFHQMRTGQAISADMARCAVFSLLNTILSEFGKLPQLLPKVNDTLKHVACSTTIEDMQNALEKLLGEIGSLLEEESRHKNEQLVDIINAYVAENYGNYSLNISMIAETLHMNPLYLSRYYKERTKDSLLDTINRVRLDHSDQLLKENRLSIQAIAERVGYNNSNSYIRAYKKYRGITPGKIREKT